MPWPIETVTKVNIASVNSSDYKSRVLTADVNLVEVRFAVQYRYADPIKVLFQVREPEETLREVSESAIREVVGQSELDDVLVGATRPQITQRTQRADPANAGQLQHRHHGLQRQPDRRAGARGRHSLAA